MMTVLATIIWLEESLRAFRMHSPAANYQPRGHVTYWSCCSPLHVMQLSTWHTCHNHCVITGITCCSITLGYCFGISFIYKCLPLHNVFPCLCTWNFNSDTKSLPLDPNVRQWNPIHITLTEPLAISFNVSTLTLFQVF
jgi:hypothetical protein